MPFVPLAVTVLLGPALGVIGAPLQAAPDASSDLVTAAGASVRPAECSSRSQTGRAPTVWERARTPQRAAYCAALAQAHARLSSDPAGADAAIDRAEAAWPGRAATRVARARVLLARGDAAAALARFDEAIAIDPRAASDPASLRDRARALARGGRLDEARAAYRALVPQSQLLPRDAQAEALVEAGLVTLALPDEGAVAPEALAFLREARSLPASPIVAEAALVLALALHRAGDAAGAATQLADAGRLGASAERAAQLAPGPAEALALAAMAAEATDPAAAPEAWDRVVAEAPTSPWRATAERRREALRDPRPAPRRRRDR